MPQLSILIPWTDRVERLETTLVSVLENQPADCQVVVALGRDYDDPYDLAGDVRLVPCLARATLLECIEAGLEACDAPVVHVLGSGLEVSAGWTGSVLRHFEDPRVAAVAPRIISGQQQESHGVVYGAGGLRKVIGTQTGTSGVWGPELRAAFYRTSALKAVGGFSQAVGRQFCDVDLALMLQAAGYHCVAEPQCMVTGTGAEMSGQGAFQQGLASERLFWRAVPSVGWFRALLAHPGAVLQESFGAKSVVAMAAQALGRMLACCQMSQYARHHLWLSELNRRSEALRSDTSSSSEKKFRIDSAHADLSDSHSKPEDLRRAA